MLLSCSDAHVSGSPEPLISAILKLTFSILPLPGSFCLGPRLCGLWAWPLPHTLLSLGQSSSADHIASMLLTHVRECRLASIAVMQAGCLQV